MGRAEARDGDGFADLSDDHDPFPSRSGDGVTRIVVAIRHSSLSTSTVTPGPGHPLDHLQRLLASANSTREESWAACDAQEHRGKGDASLSRRYAVVLWLEILVAGALSMGHHTLSGPLLSDPLLGSEPPSAGQMLAEKRRRTKEERVEVGSRAFCVLGSPSCIPPIAWWLIQGVRKSCASCLVWFEALPVEQDQ